MSIIAQFQKSFADASAPVFLPSPLDALKCVFYGAVAMKDAIASHMRKVRAEQEAFQQRLQAIGIERLMKMSNSEVIERFGQP